MGRQSNEYSYTCSFELSTMEKLAGMWPHSMGENSATEKYHVPLAEVPYYNFHFIRQGRLCYQYDDKEVMLSGGDIFFKFPFMPHKYRIIPGKQPLRLAWISFNGSQAPYLMQLAGLTREQPYRHQVLDAELDATVSQIVQLGRSYTSRRTTEMSGLMYELFSRLLRGKEEQQRGDAATQFAEDWLERSIEFIHSRYMDKITVHDVARFVSVNRTHFSETFTQRVGVSPATYLKKLKLEKAWSMLQSGGVSVTEVALSLGYADIYAFTRAFSKHFGMPPSGVKAHQA